MPRFTVDTDQLSGAGACVSQLSGQLGASRSALARVAGAGAAADHPAMAAALEGFAAVSGASVDALAGATDGIGANLSGSSSAYGTTESSAIEAVAALDGLTAIVVLDAPESELGSHPVLGLVLEAGADPSVVTRAVGPYAQRTAASGDAVDVVVLSPEDAARSEALGAPRVA